MKCDEVRKVLSTYADGEITGQMASELRDHIDQCASCKAQFEEFAVIQSKLDEMMSEPMRCMDLSDQIMASLPVQRKPARNKWVLALAAGVLLFAIGLHWVFTPNIAKHNMPKLVKNQPRPHSLPQSFTPKQPAQPSEDMAVKVPSSPREYKRKFVQLPRVHRYKKVRVVKYQQVPEVRKPVLQPKPPEVSRVAMHNERINARVETTIAITVGNTILSRTKLTVIDLAPNDYAAVTRPPLEVVRIDNAAIDGG